MNDVSDYLAAIGRKGGLKSRRSLSSDQAKEMVRVREARRAFRDFHGSCFWSERPDYKVTAKDVDWAIERLRTYGGHAGVRKAAQLCR